MFLRSSQKRHWMFASESEVAEQRAKVHQKIVDRLGGQLNQQQREEHFLTRDEERAVLKYMEKKLMEFCVMFKPPMPKGVQGTAAIYFKRFYLNNSAMDYHPKEILVTAIYLACKVEEFNVSIEQFVANINGNKERAMDIVLNNEMLLMKELRYHLTIHNAFRAVEGILIDVKARVPGLTEAAESFRGDIAKFLDDVYYTDAFFLYAPSQIALAAVTHAAKLHGSNVDPYVTDILFGGGGVVNMKQQLTSLVKAVRNVRLLVKNIQHVDGARVKPLMEKLERCRNQENNPDSAVYKRKLQEILNSGDDGGGPPTKMARMTDYEDGVEPM